LVVQAAFMCAGITAGLVAFTFQTKVDFTPLASTCYTMLWVLILVGFMQLFFPFSSQAELVTASGGAALFSLFTVLDTQMMLKRRSTDEYIICALELYLDIINLFLEILRAMDSRR